MSYVEVDLKEDNRKAVLQYDDDGKLISLYEYHETPDGEPCGGSIFLTYEDVGYKTDEWQIVDDTPENITIKPSINCDRCPSHGYIDKGGWVLGRTVYRFHPHHTQNTIQRFITGVRHKISRHRATSN